MEEMWVIDGYETIVLIKQGKGENSKYCYIKREHVRLDVPSWKYDNQININVRKICKKLNGHIVSGTKPEETIVTAKKLIKEEWAHVRNS